MAYVDTATLGSRRYLVKEKDEDLPKALTLFRRLRILDITTKALLSYYLITKFLGYYELSLF